MNAPIEFLDSDTQDVSKTLLIAVAGTTGSGKTESALRIATGIAGDNFAVIDSENKRALNKKNRYRFRHFDMQPPYSPEHYREIIEAAVQKGFGAIVIDSFSAEWDDEGGLSDDAAEALERMSKGDAARAEKLTMLAWKNPKVRHRGLMRYFRKTDIPIIFCLRAEPKVKFMKDANGKQQIVDAGWLPITEKLFGYDMLIYALMMPENPGVPVHLKKLEPEFEPMFIAGKQVTEQSGKLLAAWASGKTKQPAAAQVPVSASAGAGGSRSEHTIDNPLVATPAFAADPTTGMLNIGGKSYGPEITDESLVADIGVWCKRKKFETAYDMARGIKDEALKVATVAKIDNAKAYVEANQ